MLRYLVKQYPGCVSEGVSEQEKYLKLYTE